ncbi:hypothetical protein L1994_03365 [Methanomicrobium antiquum]|uniref:Uncharacterized protein n=1 Tax=Methanomicrobium antiquum TaxID=487686 RepID=A0AAF0FRW9_9EURY|nr:hypothetical protein [Methanomicrobium antiquum]MDD4127489.1 hypothetical protein [Methanomicrobium sp.]WFN37442.1 hypothetical protein L1994_03365 [Methanomicrobium antiquum]
MEAINSADYQNVMSIKGLSNEMKSLPVCISELFGHIEPTDELINCSLRHLSKQSLKNLDSNNNSAKGIAQGKLFESVVYEQMLEILTKCDFVRAIVKKKDDAIIFSQKAVYGQNGLFYNGEGDIVLRGNGQDLGEFDMLFVDGAGQVCFCEIMSAIPKGHIISLANEIKYKKRILSKILNQESVPFLLIIAENSKNKIIQWKNLLLTEESDSFITFPSIEEIKSKINNNSESVPLNSLVFSEKAKELNLLNFGINFDYKEIHDECVKEIIKLCRSEDFNSVNFLDRIELIKKQVFIGIINPKDIETLLSIHNIVNYKNRLSASEIRNNHDKIILAMDIENELPIIYMKEKEKKSYLKMIFTKNNEFHFKNKKNQRNAGLFEWLQNMDNNISVEDSLNVISLCS